MAREKVLCGKEEIIRAAVSIVESEGIEVLTARRIAKELGVSHMTLYNYIENLTEVQKKVVITGFADLYDSIYKGINTVSAPQNHIEFCCILAVLVYRFAMEKRKLFEYMFTTGRSQFAEDPEVRVFYNFISRMAKRSGAAKASYAEKPKSYELFDILVASICCQCAIGSLNMSEQEYVEYISYFLDRCM